MFHCSTLKETQMKAQLIYGPENTTLEITYRERNEWGDLVEKTVPLKFVEDEDGILVARCTRDFLFTATDTINRKYATN
jgi:hypothetical protein